MEGNVSLSVSLSVSRSTIKILWLFQWHPHEDFRGNASTNEWNVAQISVSPSGSLPFVFCAMMWYEIWACIVLIIENTLILILSHCAFQKGSCTKVNNPHWEYYDQNQLHPPFTLLYVTLQIVPWDGPWDLGQTADECSAPSRLWWCWGGRGALLSHLGRQDLQHPHTPREGGLLETVMVRWMIFDWLTWQTCIPTDKFYLIEPLQQFETIL